MKNKASFAEPVTIQYRNPLELDRFYLAPLVINQGPVPERRINSISRINVLYFRDNFIPGTNSVPERRNSSIQGINLG